MDYKKCWDTLKAESGGRWCQPHPLSNELLTIGELLRNMERRASAIEELAATVRPDGPANNAMDAIALAAKFLDSNPYDVDTRVVVHDFVKFVREQQHQ
jgi:hypothetical protein